MSAPLGFVLLVNPFSRLGQSARLIGRLNAMFDFPPIAVHHDFGKTPRFLEGLSPNVRLVRPHVDTKWADFTCIEAAVAALRLLYAGPQKPDWWVYLSGADYPIKPASRILADLRASPFGAHIQHLPLVYGACPTWWQKMSFRRVCAVPLRYPWVTQRLHFQIRTKWISHPLLTRGRLPYTERFRPYAGEAWFCAGRRAAEAILKFHDSDVAFAAHARRILVPEETYFHTVLANDPALKLSQDYLRYVDWSKGGSHPRVLTVDDLPAMEASTAHFARKFPDAEKVAVLDELDRLIS